MKKYNFIGKIILVLIISFPCATLFAQTMNRLQMKNNILTNIYQNANHAVTGQALQNVLINQNYSYINLKSDTNFISRFDTGYTYYEGMIVLTSGDSLYKCSIPVHHGIWNAAHFSFVQLMGGGAPGGHTYDIQFNSNGVFAGSDAFQLNASTVILNAGLNLSLSPGSQISFNSFSDQNWTIKKGSGFGDGIIGGNNELSILLPATNEGFSLNSSMTYSLFQVRGDGGVYFKGSFLDASSVVIMSPSARTLTDHKGTESGDWDNRALINPGGANLNWVNGLHPANNGDIITKGFADSAYSKLIYHFNIESGTSYTPTNNDFDGQTIILMTNVSTVVVTLPNATTVAIGEPLIIKAPDLTNGTILTITPNFMNKLDNQYTSVSFSSNGSAPQPVVKIVSDGTNWYIIP